MDFYFIIVPALVFSLMEIVYLLALARRDKQVFATQRQLGEVMAQILERNDSLTRAEYSQLRQQLDALDPIPQSSKEERSRLAHALAGENQPIKIWPASTK